MKGKGKGKGKVYLVGAGPGDPDLITVRASRLLGEADAVLYDRLVPRGVLGLARDGAQLIPVGKGPDGGGEGQDLINDLMAELAERGMNVVRLKGGDPFVYGRGEEECSFLTSRGIQCEVVPGVSSVTGVPTCAGIPVASRLGSSSFAVVTGHEAAGKERNIDVSAIAAAVDTLIVVMGVGNLREIAERVMEAMGPKAAAALVLNGCTADQIVVKSTLSDIAEEAARAGAKSPGVLVVGRAVDIMEKLSLGRGDRGAGGAPS